MARQRKDEPEGGANWMDTYGDLVTLLLTFFVLLFAFSTIDSQKWRELVGSFSGRSVFEQPAVNPNEPVHETVSPLPPSPDEEDEQQSSTEEEEEVQAAFDALFEAILQYIEENRLEDSLLARNMGDTILLRFADSILFQSGYADLQNPALVILEHVGEIVSRNVDYVQMVRIEGHTDNVPINNAQFASNWDLSVGRAMSVLSFFIDGGAIPPGKLSAVGFSEYHPIDDNGTAAGRANNRRVDFVIERRIAGDPNAATGDIVF